MTYGSPVEGSQYSFTCAPATQRVGVANTATANCTIIPLYGNQIRIDSLTASTGSIGWTVAAGGAPVVGSRSWSPGVTLSAGQSYTFPVQMTPTICGAAPTATVSLGGSLTWVTGSGTVTGARLPARSVSATLDTSVTTQTVTIVDSLDLVQVTYDYARPQSATSQVTVRVTVSGCQPWQIQSNLSAFSRQDGTAGNGIVPRTTNVAIGGPIFETAKVVSVATPGSILLTPVSQVLFSGPSPNGTVSFTSTLTLSYTIPANTLPGSYKATIRFTTGAGP